MSWFNSRISMRSLAVIASVVSAVGAHNVAAQVRPGAVPTDIVLAILRNADGMEEEAGITLGDSLPAALSGVISLPPGARVLATLTPRLRVIGLSPGTPDSVRLWFAADFERRGYTIWPEYAMRGGGFRPAEPSPRGPWCGAGMYLTTSVRSGAGGGSEFTVMATPATSCSSSRGYRPAAGYANFTSAQGLNPPALPLLYAPRGADLSPRCARRAEASASTAEAGISTAMSADALLAHYGRQLDSAGWHADPTSPGAYGTWTRSDSTGHTVRVAISVMPAPTSNGCRAVTMTATEVR